MKHRCGIPDKDQALLLKLSGPLIFCVLRLVS